MSAAISAMNFVSSAVNEQEPLITPESRVAVREDVQIVDASLSFINDLLRNMIDLHRSAEKELQLDLAPVCVYSDILEPVSAMLYNRGGNFKILVECPEELYVVSDKLRLKQIVLNLARNSKSIFLCIVTPLPCRTDIIFDLTVLLSKGVKFVVKGFVRLRAEVVDGSVIISVEDSGPGKSAFCLETCTV